MKPTENNLYILEGLIIAEILTLKEALTMLGIELRKDIVFPYIYDPKTLYTFSSTISCVI